MTVAKGIANSFPIGNTTTTPKIAAKLVDKNLTLRSFGDNPVSWGTSLAPLEAMEEKAYPAARGRSGHVPAEWSGATVGDMSTNCREVGGKRLMQAAALVTGRKTKESAPDAVLKIFEKTGEPSIPIGKGNLSSNVLFIALRSPLPTITWTGRC